MCGGFLVVAHKKGVEMRQYRDATFKNLLHNHYHEPFHFVSAPVQLSPSPSLTQPIQSDCPAVLAQ